MNQAAVLSIALMLTGCVSAKTFRTGSGVVYAPTKPDTVLVFFSADDVKRPFEVIGEIMAEGSSGWGATDSALVSKAQKKAAEIGAHAIVITKEKGASATAGVLLGANDKKQRVQAIRFTDGTGDGPPRR
jgi:hypothetical protein